MMYQCRLRKHRSWRPHVFTETVAWVEDAQEGHLISVDGEKFVIYQVYQPGFPRETLRAKQNLDRHSLPSIKD